MCHGTMLAWCSISVSTTTSPRPRFERPQLWATRLSASVAFLVNTTSRAGAGAPMNRPTLVRAASKRRVASSAMAYTPRWTLACVVSSYSRMASRTAVGRWDEAAESR